MKRFSVFLAAGALVVLSSVAAGATAGHAGGQGRSGTIAFLRGVGAGPAGLFAIGADGSRIRRLTPSGVDVASFEWAPDGSRIAYLDGGGALRLVRPDGTGREVLAVGSPLRSPWFLSWSPDGKAIAVDARDPGTSPPPRNSAGHLRIYVIPTEGGASRRLPSGDAQSLDWSPLGDEIVYGSGSGLQRIIRTDGSKPRPFFRRPPTHTKWLATWSPDGTHVGFTGHVRHGRYPHPGDWYDAIYVADTDGTNLHLVTSHAYNEYGFVVAGRAVDSLRQGEPRRRLRDRRRRTEQPPADARFAQSHLVSDLDLGAGRALDRLRNRPKRQRRHLPDRLRRPQQGSTHKLSRG